MSAPNFRCSRCGLVDWSLDEKYKKWVCTPCSLSGSEIQSPSTEPSNIDVPSFVESIYQAWELAHDELNKAEADPHLTGKGTKNILARAKFKRAEEAYEAANIKASAASLIEQLYKSSSTGDIYIDIPELQIRLVWDERTRNL